MDRSLVSLNGGTSATPVVERSFLEMAANGRAVQRLCLIRSQGAFTLWCLVAGTEHPLTVELFRGGTRTWATLPAAVRWVEKKLPGVKTIEVVLKQN